MSKVCVITNRRTLKGNNVSHAHNKTKRSFELNLQYKRFWMDSEKRWVKLKVSAKGIRDIDKKGIEYFLTKKPLNKTTV